MLELIISIKKEVTARSLCFVKKPILIGGTAMEYYGMRKSGKDIDFVVCDEDYHTLAHNYPDNRKDIWGDLGVVIEPFEIWRCIMLLDYEFYAKDAVDEGIFLVVSLDRLLLTRVFAMDNPKYMNDLNLIKDYYRKTFQNQDYLKNAEAHIASYKSADGIILGGKYIV